jgi:hypothetical protein
MRLTKNQRNKFMALAKIIENSPGTPFEALLNDSDYLYARLKEILEEKDDDTRTD